MKKSIFLFFAAILCAIGAKAFDQSAVDLYFDNSTSKWTECYVYIGHNRDKGWVSCYTMSRVSGTQYLWKLPANFNGGNKWGGATGWVVCKEKWWDSQEEDIYKFVYHGSNNVTNLTTTAWVNSKIYKADGTTTVDHYGQKPTVYKLTTSTKSNYTVTINTVEGGTLTVKDYDDNAVATGASKIHLTVLKFSAAPASGYVLDGVEINDGNNITTITAADLATNTHTLTSAVTITPVWRATTSTVTVTATATNGTVTGGGVVEEGTSVTLTATPADGYKFVNWTVGGAEVSTANPYTFTANEDVTVTANFEELPKVTLYFVNHPEWTNLKAHVWDNNSTPYKDWNDSESMTNTGEDKDGYAVYSYTFPSKYTNIIFKGDGQQTQNNVAAYDVAKPYFCDDKWYASLAEIPALGAVVTYDYYVIGTVNSWTLKDASYGMTDDNADGVYEKVVTLAAGQNQMKINNGTWDNASTFGYDNLSVAYEGVSRGKDGDDNNIIIDITPGKDITVKFDKNTSKITLNGLTPVTYSDITIKAYTEGSAPQIWWWDGGSKCPDADKTDNPSNPGNKYTWETAPTMTAVAGEANWYEYTFKDVNDQTGICFKFKNATTASGNFQGIKADACYDVRDIENAKTTECGVTPSDCLECSGVYLKGEFNTWLPDNEFMKTGDANVVTLSITLEKGNYDFKVHGDEWYGNTGDMTRENTNQAWTFSKDVDDKANIRVDVSGEYIFSWKISEKQLTVTYPEFPSLSTQPEKLYFRPTTDWKSANAEFAAFFLDGDKGTNAKWENFTDADGDGVYEVDNDKKYLTIIICRMNPEGTDPDNWKNKWNQSADLTIPTTQYLNSWIDNENKWDGANGIWTVLVGESDNSTTLSAANSQTVNTLVNRQFESGKLYTISLPFALDAEQVETIFGTGTTLYQFAQLVKENEELVLYFSTPSAIAAATPYLIEPTQNVSGFIVENATISTTPNNISFTVDATAVSMEAVLSASATATTEGKYWLASDTYLYNNPTTLKSLRALFTISTPSGIAPRVRVALEENGETGLENITDGKNTAIKVIENGQLIIIRNGEKFNAQGVRL